MFSGIILANELTKKNVLKSANFKKKEEKVIMHINTTFSQLESKLLSPNQISRRKYIKSVLPQ